MVPEFKRIDQHKKSKEAQTKLKQKKSYFPSSI